MNQVHSHIHICSIAMIHVDMKHTYTCMHICMYFYTSILQDYTFTYIYTHAYTCMYIYTCMHVSMLLYNVRYPFSILCLATVLWNLLMHQLIEGVL